MKSEFVINPQTKAFLDTYIKKDEVIKNTLINHLENAYEEGYYDGRIDGYSDSTNEYREQLDI